jgi:serine/threonine protein kinase
MGVVYKARQLGLKRLVALKMILHGAHAGIEERMRFRIEGEAIARLQHPNIVQVYQIGEHEGLPFFSLEFCGGGSLADRLAKGPLSPREAAALVVTLARAVHAAHQQGIIHRDLKPGNILFTGGAGQPAVVPDANIAVAASGFSTPDKVATISLKITDFGLAKRLDQAGQTRTGSILGTPSYMAPEQASGQGAAVTTLADVYALGAILYECLTGQPPFRGATALDTILAVLEQSPVSPSTRRPGLDRGLELICLRCLEKDPTRRYNSAVALADDLQRWLTGEPLSVRPHSLFLLVRSWVRQNFGSAGWTVIIGLACGLVVGLSMWIVLIQPGMADLSRVYTVLPNQPRPWLVFPWNPPTWLIQFATLLSIVVAASMGLWTALLVRPRHSQADLAAGGVTGLIASIVLFMASFGWCAIMLRSATSQDDLWLVTQAAWSAQPETATSKLLQRYPDLQHVTAEQRGVVVYDMMMTEQLTAMPTGMWTGMFLSLSLGVVLGISGTAVAGPLVRQNIRRWILLFRYLEIVLPGAVVVGQLFLLAMLGLFSTTRMNLPLWYPPVVLATSALVIAAALRRWPWPVRLTLFLCLAAAVLTSRFFEIRN